MTELSFINVRPLIKIDGEDNSDLRQALKTFVVNMPLSGMAHGELTATNWVASGEAGELGYGFQDLGFGKTLEIYMGEDNSTLVFSGEITAVEERYGSGAPQIIILVQDKLHRLARQRNNRTFEDQSIDDVVNTIAGELGLSADVSVSSEAATYHQLNESDLAFLMRLLNPYDASVRIDGDTLRVKAEEPDPEPLELSAQRSAMQVRLLADLNHQPIKVTVKGFNIGNNELVSEEADALATPPDGITAKDIIDELTWPGEDIVPQPTPRSQSEAQGFAKAHFSRHAKRFVSGELCCIGEPEMKSGREISLSGVSPRFVGTYQVVHCVHRFDGNKGYETYLKINRPDGQR